MKVATSKTAISFHVISELTIFNQYTFGGEYIPSTLIRVQAICVQQHSW